MSLFPTRRSLLQGAGALGLLGAALGHRSARAAGPRRLVIWWSGGGWDTSYVFDPHFETNITPRSCRLNSEYPVASPSSFEIIAPSLRSAMSPLIGS